MSASSRPTADKQRPPEIQSVLDAHRKALQTRKSGGYAVYSGIRIDPPNSRFFYLAGIAFGDDLESNHADAY